MKKSLFIRCLTLALGLSVLLSSPLAQAEEIKPHPLAVHYGTTKDLPNDPKGLGGLARKMNDPTGNIWQLQVEFDTVLQKGDITDGDHKTQYQLEIQPIIPIPLTKDWNLITRPVIPIVSSEIPQLSLSGVDFDRKTGLGDT